MPELRDQSSNTESQDVGLYSNNTINPSIKETNIFLENVFKELSDIFTFDIIHVGVDERPKESWEGSPKMVEYMKKNNLSTFEEVQDILLHHYPQDTPVIIGYRVSWEDEWLKIVPLNAMASTSIENGLIRTTLYVISPALAQSEKRSKLYEAKHSHLFRSSV